MRQLQHFSGLFIPLFRHLFQAVVVEGDNSQLRGGKKGVYENQHNEQQNRNKRIAALLRYGFHRKILSSPDHVGGSLRGCLGDSGLRNSGSQRQEAAE